MATLFEKWMKIANHDLRVEKKLFKGREYLTATFFLQQTCEKALKACFIAKGKEYPYIHNLVSLATITLADRINGPEKKRFFDLFEELTPFYIKARYPNFKESLAKTTSKISVQNKIIDVEGFLSWLKQNVKSRK